MITSCFDERKQWRESRSLGIGGSDIAALVEMSPWSDRLDVWRSKTGDCQDDGFKPRDAFFWGNFLEEGIRLKYAEASGFQQSDVLKPTDIADLFPGQAENRNGQTILHHPELKFALGTPDGLVPQWKRGLEIKTAGFKGIEWGRQGSDEIPDHYRLQCSWYMALTGYEVWDVAALFSGNRLEVFTVQRDREIEDAILFEASDFWSRYVLPRVPPPVDGSDAWKKYLAKLHAFGNQTILDPCDTADKWAEDWRKAVLALDQATAEEQTAKNQLGNLIGACKAIRLGDGGKVQWIRPRPENLTDWEAVARGLFAYITMPEEQRAKVEMPTLDALKNTHTIQRAKSAYIRMFEAPKQEGRTQP